MAAPAPVSPLAPKSYPDLPPIEGVRFATAAAGIKYRGRTDVMLLAIVLLAGLGELTDGALSAVETRIMRRRG